MLGPRIIARRITVYLVLAALPIGAAVAHACGVDGIPSLSADGVLAHRNGAPGATETLAQWAPFVFPVAYRSGRSIRFGENMAEVRRSLPPQAFVRPWRWSFGDGTSGTGVIGLHSYRRAGLFKLIVSAYYNEYHSWYAFDSALIRITAARP